MTLVNLCSAADGCYIILYADDILLLSPSVTHLERLLHRCEEELTWLDTNINFQKSCCSPVGPPFWRNICAVISSSNDRLLPSASEMRYLSVFFTNSRALKCSLDAAKRGFYRAANSIFRNVGRIASEEVVLHLIKYKCLSILCVVLRCWIWTNLSAQRCKQLQTFAYPSASKSLITLHGLTAISCSQSLPFKSVTDRQKHRNFSPSVAREFRANHTRHGDRRCPCHFCASNNHFRIQRRPITSERLEQIPSIFFKKIDRALNCSQIMQILLESRKHLCSQFS